MMPLSLAERIVCVLLVVAIVCSLGHAFVGFIAPVSIEQQRSGMQSMLDLRQALGLVERVR